VFGVADERSERLVWVAFTLCDEWFAEGGCREEEGARVDDNEGRANNERSWMYPQEGMWVSAY
jgi:hypothetical protein